MPAEQIPETDLASVPDWLAGGNWTWAAYTACIGASDADGAITTTPDRTCEREYPDILREHGAETAVSPDQEREHLFDLDLMCAGNEEPSAHEVTEAHTR